MSQAYSDLELSVDELASRLEAAEALQVLDVRAPVRLEAGAVEVREPAKFHNVRGSEVLAATDPATQGLTADLPVVTVCGLGNDSRVVARHLAERGYDARSLTGGMREWMSVLVPRELEAPPGFDRFVQFDRLGKGSLAYLLVSDGEALIVDPPRNVQPFLAAIEESEARLVAVADTHVHADYISGGPELAGRTGVPYLLHPADADYPYDGTPGELSFEPLSDGQRIQIGRGEVEVMHSPGHTLGSVTLLVGGRDALTGDFLFVESIGRPDLAGKADAWTPDLWRSIERARTEWSDDVSIRPAHYAGESERNGDRTIGRPWGILKERNEVLQIRDPEAFAGWIANRTVTPPDAYPKIKAVNIGLMHPSAEEVDVLEAGKNECAVG